MANSSRLAYALALAVGLATAWRMFPPALVAGALPLPQGAATDFLQHVTGQVAFFDQPWRWPLLVVRGLDAPVGTNIALTDSIPLEAVLLKLERSLAAILPGLPVWRQGISLYQAFLWIMQPLAATFALRSFGERRLLPALAISILAIAMPTFLVRAWHTALDSHYLLLLALGLYARCVAPAVGPASARSGLRPLVLLVALTIATLTIHPYLMVMVAALLLAVPLTLACRLDRRTIPAAIAAAAAAVGVAALGALLGYWTSNTGGGGFGTYSMNLASPFWPGHSAIFPNVDEHAVDATGGQLYEGDQYLGAGLLLLFAACLCTAPARRSLGAALLRHPGLAAISVGLTLFALSNQIWLFHWRIATIHTVYPGHMALRASGRLFWDVAYLLLTAAVFVVARSYPRRAATLLLAVAATLQYFDAGPRRQFDRDGQLAMVGTPDATERQFAAILPHYRTLRLALRIECDGRAIAPDMRTLFRAAVAGLSTNSMYTARRSPRTDCFSPLFASDQAGLATLPDDPATLVALTGESRLAGGAWLAAAGLRCGTLGDDVLCSRDGAGLSPLPPPVPPPMPVGIALPATRNGPGGAFLFGGWNDTEDWGTWSNGPTPRIVLPPSAAGGTLSLSLKSVDSRGVDRVLCIVRSHGRELARLDVGPVRADYRIALPPAPSDGPVALDLTLSRTADWNPDPRHPGIGLFSIRLDPTLPAQPPT